MNLIFYLVYKLVFRQTLPYLYERNEWRKNPTNPLSDNYAILNELERFRHNDGRFYFRMAWPGDETVYEWSQTSNPVNETLAGYQAISVPYTGQHWRGLEPSTVALMDGSINHSNWFYAIGSHQKWNNGIPSYAKTDNDSNYPQKVVTLYVQTETHKGEKLFSSYNNFNSDKNIIVRNIHPFKGIDLFL